MSIFIFFARADILVPISLVRVHEPLPLAKNYQLVCGDESQVFGRNLSPRCPSDRSSGRGALGKHYTYFATKLKCLWH